MIINSERARGCFVGMGGDDTWIHSAYFCCGLVTLQNDGIKEELLTKGAQMQRAEMTALTNAGSALSTNAGWLETWLTSPEQHIPPVTDDIRPFCRPEEAH